MLISYSSWDSLVPIVTLVINDIRYKYIFSRVFPYFVHCILQPRSCLVDPWKHERLTGRGVTGVPSVDIDGSLKKSPSGNR